MNETSPSLEEWKRLYDLMARVKKLAPWEYMHEDDIFGVKMPGAETLGFVSVMGTLGEHLSVAVYLGEKGLGGFWKMHELGQRLTPEFVLQVPQIQGSFEDRELITAEDRKVMKALGLKFHGGQVWPQFRSYRPSCFPWYLEKDEAALLACALEQLLDVAPRFQENPDLFIPARSDTDCLVRVHQNGKWEDSVLRVNPWKDPPIQLSMNTKALAELKRMMPGKMIIEADLAMIDHPTQNNRKERPFFPYLLMLAEHDTGIILASDLLNPLPSLEGMMGEVPMRVVESLANRLAPQEIQVKDDLLFVLLQPVAKEIGFKLTKTSRLRSIDGAKKEMLRFMDRF
jgi:hypothetical protein